VRRRHALLALALVAVLAGCGGGSSKHAAVRDYITRVDQVEQGMAGPIGQVTQVNRDFARSQTSAGMHKKLVKSESTMRTLRKRLATLVAPPEAKRLQSLLLQLVNREVELTHETVQLGVFVPRYQAALKPLVAADAGLKKELGATAKGAAATKKLDAEKADELDAYARAASSVIGVVEKLVPPPVWKPPYDSQLGALRGLRSTATALGQAIRTNDSAALPELLQRFDAAAVANESVAAQKRQIAAVKAYDARIRQITSLAGKVQLERARLQKTYS
jgi:hypothetical protein